MAASTFAEPENRVKSSQSKNQRRTAAAVGDGKVRSCSLSKGKNLKGVLLQVAITLRGSHYNENLNSAGQRYS